MKFEKGELLHGGILVAELSQIAVDAVASDRWTAHCQATFHYRPLDGSFQPLIGPFTFLVPGAYSTVELIGDSSSGEGDENSLVPIKLKGVDSWKPIPA